MKIKPFIITVYTLAGLTISALTALMTFLIIGTPIGMKMFLQIIFAIILVLPIIILISYYLGKYLSNKFIFIAQRLENIKDENFESYDRSIFINEIDKINAHMNFLSTKLDHLISDLKHKNQNLSDLLVSMAHDIKTPLSILNGHIEEIEDGLVKDEDMPEVLEQMQKEIDFLNELTIDMLDFISSMKNHKEKEDIYLYKMIEDNIFPILPHPLKEVVYINNIDKDFKCLFNKTDLKKISMNLLSNSIRFTNEGYIKVEIKDDIIIFENTGQKIEEEYKDQIFEPFFTVSKSKNRKSSGFGLGLSIVKNLAKNNGYECFLNSSDNIKTSFYLKKLS